MRSVVPEDEEAEGELSPDRPSSPLNSPGPSSPRGPKRYASCSSGCQLPSSVLLLRFGLHLNDSHSCNHTLYTPKQAHSMQRGVDMMYYLMSITSQ